MISFDLRIDRRGFSLDVSGQFDEGVTAVFGPSGAGKTTLLNCLAGSMRPDSGSIEIDGENVYSSADGIWVRPEKRRIGTVYQDGALFPHLSVRRNIDFGWKLVPAEQRRLDPLEIAELLGLSDLLERMPSELSGGERQRVAIARALAISPRLFFLEEPLASLDVARKGSILNYLKRVHDEFKIPMVYVSHSVTEVVSIASHAMLIRDGSVLGFDRPSALLLTAALDGSSVERFENILYGVVGDSTDQLTTIEIDRISISTRHQNKNPGEKVVVSLGANQIILAPSEPNQLSARNVLKGRVKEIWSSNGKVFAEVDVGPEIIVELTESALNELGISVRSDVFLIFKSSSVDVFDA